MKTPKTLLISLTILTPLFFAQIVSAQTKDKDFYKNKAIEDMNAASLWLIQEGVHLFSKAFGNMIILKPFMNKIFNLIHF